MPKSNKPKTTTKKVGRPKKVVEPKQSEIELPPMNATNNPKGRKNALYVYAERIKERQQEQLNKEAQEENERIEVERQKALNQKAQRELVENLKDVEKGSVVEGLGDVVKHITNFLGIETCDACEERRKKLNEMFPFFKKGNELTQQEMDFIKMVNKQNIISSEERNYIFEIYNKAFNQKLVACNCPGTILDLKGKLYQYYLSKYSNDINE